ncbi:Der1-like family-domain-containing protein [Lentinula raphanica]|nr:Der1-like family-domain-containing protein [Lentinula raphanica]KAJ3768841.1 Der1-like family-domain-containing protein [Lentinula raphanica]KAJ3824648.1 Der1-like family-domain-containing protein [Lentinula raphanica]KAJ3970842.1 Der1-like family-domain-containing protein [Lentinula raphanica]
MDAFVAEIKKIPPVTRFLSISLISVTGSVLMHLVNPYKVLYHHSLVFGARGFEVWRLWSSFFLGSGGLSFIFEIIMLYRTGNELESGPFLRKSSDFAFQLTVACGAIIATSFPLSSTVFFRPLLLCLVYLSSQLAPPGAQTSLYGLITIPVKYFPFALLGMDLLNGGPGAAATALPGAVIGHLWWWGVFGSEPGARAGPMAEYGRAPRWLARWFGESSGSGSNAGSMRGTGGGVHVVPPRPRAEENAQTTHGYRWGSGQRLGNN